MTWNPPAAGLRHPVGLVSTTFISVSPVAGMYTYKPLGPEAHTQIDTHTVDLPTASPGHAFHPGPHSRSLFFPCSLPVETHTHEHTQTHMQADHSVNPQIPRSVQQLAGTLLIPSIAGLS